jgi:hypothetical protein
MMLGLLKLLMLLSPLRSMLLSPLLVAELTLPICCPLQTTISLLLVAAPDFNPVAILVAAVLGPLSELSDDRLDEGKSGCALSVAVLESGLARYSKGTLKG